MIEGATTQIIKNSPIEFVVSGPLGGRDRILIRSDKAGLDIVAISSQSIHFDRRRRSPDPFIALFGGHTRQLNVVSSMSVPDFRKEADIRKSSLNIAWIGNASIRRIDRIRDTFNRCLPDIINALQAGSAEDVEFSIAPVILDCSQANEELRRIRRAMVGILGIYGIIGLGFFVYLMLKGNFSF